MRHLTRAGVVSATYHEGEALAVTVHGGAVLFDVLDPARPELREAMLGHYLPLQGRSFAEWLEEANPIGVRIGAEKMFGLTQRGESAIRPAAARRRADG